MKKIALVTRDCAGANACIRAVVRTACFHQLEVSGVLHGYQGLMRGEFVSLGHNSVSGIINRGGTVLKTVRAREFYTVEGRQQAAKQIRENDINGLIVVGGNGSLTGAHLLATEHGIPLVGIPATIDNDISGIPLSIGANTAVNVAMDALDKIRDTATSMERIFVVEVMGRDCGFIASRVALAGGCEEAIVPEQDYDMEKICREISRGNELGKISWIIIVAEGKAKASDIASQVRQRTGLETREVVLGHVQRGGSPTASDRLLALQLGNYAVELLLQGKTDICVGLEKDELFYIPLAEAVKTKDIKVDNYHRLIKILT